MKMTWFRQTSTFKKILKSIPILWWALGQLKCTSKVFFVVEDDSESGV